MALSAQPSSKPPEVMLQMLGAKGGCPDVVFLFVPGRLNNCSLPGSPLKHACSMQYVLLRTSV